MNYICGAPLYLVHCHLDRMGAKRTPNGGTEAFDEWRIINRPEELKGLARGRLHVVGYECASIRRIVEEAEQVGMVVVQEQMA